MRTVLGDVPAAELGAVLAHEHLVCHITDEQWLRPDDVLGDLRAFKACGGGTVVELTNTGMGQDAAALRHLSQASRVRVVCGTGFYLQRFYPAWVSEATLAELEAFMRREVERGVVGTDVRAGVVGEIGTSQDAITPDEEKVMRAAARVARDTGVPLSTHTSLGRLGLEQLDIIAAEGLPLDRVSVGHLDLVADSEYHTAIARRGAFVQLDTFGKNQYQADSIRVACLAELVRRGYERQVLLSNDISRPTYLAARGGWGYGHLLQTIVPELRAAGVSEAAIGHMLVENPARFLRMR